MRKLASLKHFLTDFFYYTKAERDSQVLLMSLILILFLVGIFLPHFYKAEPVDFSEYESEVNTFVASLEAAKANQKGYRNYDDDKNAASYTLFNFDPNTATVEDFQKLGLSEKVALSIERARSKNYHFYDKKDFEGFYGLKRKDFERLESYIQIAPREKAKKYDDKKPLAKPSTPIAYFDFDPNTISKDSLLLLGLKEYVADNIIKFQEKGWEYKTPEKFGKTYGLDPSKYEALKPHIKIKVKPIAQKTTPKSYEYEDARIITTPTIVDINRSSVEQWESLSGIGPGYAKRIVEYRDELGGFQNIAQVATTYKLPDSTFQKIKTQLRSSPILRKLKINQLSQAQLMKHPYISKRNAIALSGYIKFNGAIAKAQDLVDLKIMTPAELAKVKPYLDFSTNAVE